MIDWLRRDRSDPQVELADRVLPIAISRNRRARRLILRLAPDGSEVRITLPTWCSTSDAVAFARVRTTWLETQLAKVPPRRDPLDSGSFDFRGEPVSLAWRSDAPRRPRLEDGNLHIGGARESLERRLRLWLEKEALHLLANDAADYCSRAGLDPDPVRLSRAQRRWGSCSSEGVLRINWRLIHAPDRVRRSVVAHEVAHLSHFDHSPAFHAHLAAIYEDDIAKANAWLSAHGRGLYAAFG